MNQIPAMTGTIFGATAAAFSPVSHPQPSNGELIGATVPCVEHQEAVGSFPLIPPAPFSIGKWFRHKMPIPGTDAFVSFKREPTIMFHFDDAAYIEEWGVRIPLDSLVSEKVRLLVVSQYRRLSERARRNLLTHEERGFWKSMVADSDYADFCQRTAPLAVVTGVRMRSVGNKVEVLWNGSDAEVLAGNFAEQLAIVADGEEFLARGRFVDGTLAALSDVAPIGKPDSVDLDELFGRS